MTDTILEAADWPGLPKWPAVYITGQSVNPEQAKEIIFRTDRSLTSPGDYAIGGNDDQFKDRVETILGWKPLLKTMEGPGLVDSFELAKAWSVKMSMIETCYVYNDWLSSSRPGGWVRPDGMIQFEGRNYGKWPSVEELLLDWQALATAFPYLDLACTVYDREYCEPDPKPLCTILVKGQVATVHRLAAAVVQHPTIDHPDLDHRLLEMIRGNHGASRAWPEGWLEEFAERSRQAMTQVMDGLHV